MEEQPSGFAQTGPTEPGEPGTRWWGGALAFAVGVAVAVVAILVRNSMQETQAPVRLVVIVSVSLGSLGALLRQIGRGLMQGLSFNAAAGVDESKRTSKFTLVVAGLLFVPLWLGALWLLIGSLAPSASLERLAAWSVIATFLSALVFGLVGEWRKPA